MSEIKDIFVGQKGIVATVHTNASLADATAVALEIKFPNIVFTAIAYDDSESVKYIDESNMANGLNKDDMTLLPTGPIQIDDAYYLGATGRFKGINIVISQDGVGTWILTWEYWDGSSWSSLSNVVDGTSNFMNKGLRTIVFDLPSGWETTDVDDQTDELYFIRARITTADADPNQQPLGAIVSLANISITGIITNSDAVPPTEIGDSSNFGEFTATIGDAVFEFKGTYFMRGLVTVGASGLFKGKTFTQPIKEDFGQ